MYRESSFCSSPDQRDRFLGTPQSVISSRCDPKDFPKTHKSTDYPAYGRPGKRNLWEIEGCFLGSDLSQAGEALARTNEIASKRLARPPGASKGLEKEIWSIQESYSQQSSRHCTLGKGCIDINCAQTGGVGRENWH